MLRLVMTPTGNRIDYSDPTSAYMFHSEVRPLDDAVPAFLVSSMEEDGDDSMSMRFGVVVTCSITAERKGRIVFGKQGAARIRNGKARHLNH